MKTKAKLTEEHSAKNKSNLGFKNGMLGKFVWLKQTNINKGKGKKNKDT